MNPNLTPQSLISAKILPVQELNQLPLAKLISLLEQLPIPTLILSLESLPLENLTLFLNKLPASNLSFFLRRLSYEKTTYFFCSLSHEKLLSLILNGNMLATKEFIKRCKEEGVLLNPTIDCKGSTLLQRVIQKNFTEIANLLIKKGANVNTFDLDHNVPLHEAAKNKNKNLINALLKRKANPFILNNENISAARILESEDPKKYSFYNLSYIFYSSSEQQKKSNPFFKQDTAVSKVRIQERKNSEGPSLSVPIKNIKRKRLNKGPNSFIEKDPRVSKAETSSEQNPQKYFLNGGRQFFSSLAMEKQTEPLDLRVNAYSKK